MFGDILAAEQLLLSGVDVYAQGNGILPASNPSASYGTNPASTQSSTDGEQLSSTGSPESSQNGKPSSSGSPHSSQNGRSPADDEVEEPFDITDLDAATGQVQCLPDNVLNSKLFLPSDRPMSKMAAVNELMQIGEFSIVEEVFSTTLNGSVYMRLTNNKPTCELLLLQIRSTRCLRCSTTSCSERRATSRHFIPC